MMIPLFYTAKPKFKSSELGYNPSCSSLNDLKGLEDKIFKSDLTCVLFLRDEFEYWATMCLNNNN